MFDIIRSSWAFLGKQPALRPVAVWLVFLPLFLMGTIGRFLQGSPDLPGEMRLLGFLAMLLLILLLIWGEAAVLLIGKRLLQHKAGRSRTSFDAAVRQSRAFLVPLLLTTILRACFTILWGVLLIVPGIIYYLSTSFASVIIVTEGKAYREALNASRAALRGQWWRGIGLLAGIALVLFVPVNVAGMLLELMIFDVAPYSPVIVDIIESTLEAVASVVFMLSVVQVYGKMKG